MDYPYSGDSSPSEDSSNPLDMHSVPKLGTGLKPRKYLDHKNYDYGRTFGTTEVLLSDLNFEAGITNPSQNQPDNLFGNPAFPNGCTAFTTTDIATDEDKVQYNPGFTYARTLLIEDAAPNSPCSIEDSMKSSTDYGLQAHGETDTDALTHRRAPYFEIRPHNGQDWFDAARSAIQTNKRSISVGTQWFPEFTASGGVVDDFNLRSTTDWHCYKVSGWIPKGTNIYLIVKPWLGPEYGDNGFFYFSRTAFNKLMSVSGTGMFTNAHAQPGDIQTVRLSIQQLILSLSMRLLGKLVQLLAIKKQSVVPLQAPVVPVAPSLPIPPQSMTLDPVDTLLPWNTTSSLSHENWHNVRVLADLEGLSHQLKEELCATVWGESDFDTHARLENKDKLGRVWSTDAGICQWNSYWHGKEITTAEAFNNPEKAVRLMCKYFLAGQADQWVAHSSGAFKAHLNKTL